MSVTFSVTMDHNEAIAYNLTCDITGPLNDAPLSWDRAGEVAFAHQVTCQDDICQHYGPDKDEVRLNQIRTDLDVNLANGNARYILDALGVQASDLCGTLTAEDFLGRCLLATAIAPVDEGTPSYVAAPAGGAPLATQGATMIMCGRPEGYLHGTLARLTTLAEYARTQGRTITWA